MANEPDQTTPVVVSRRSAITALAGLVGVVVLLVGIRLISASGDEGRPEPALAPLARNDAGALPGLISTVTDQQLSAVGAGTAPPLHPRRLPALVRDGRPVVLYVGAEWCPYCAAERWALVAALGRFGTFQGLKLTRSSASDAFPNTETFSFDGARYRSAYLAFDAVELQDREHRQLQQMTPAQKRVFERYDRQSLTDRANGAIPFVDLGGRFLLSGAQFDPGVLGAQNAHDIATAVQRSSSAQAKGIVGAANQLTAALCTLTNGQPRATCSLPIIQRLEQTQASRGA